MWKTLLIVLCVIFFHSVTALAVEDWSCAPPRCDPPGMGLCWEPNPEQAESFQIWASIDGAPRQVLKAVWASCNTSERCCDVSWEGEAVFTVIPHLGDQTHSSSAPSEPARIWPNVAGPDGKVGFRDFVAALTSFGNLVAVLQLYGAELGPDGRYLRQ